jgi:hypothetical protein
MALESELEALTAIYGPTCVRRQDGDGFVRITLSDLIKGSTASICATYYGGEKVPALSGESLPRGKASSLIAHLQAEALNHADEGCLYFLAETLRALLAHDNQMDTGENAAPSAGPHDPTPDVPGHGEAFTGIPDIYIGPPIVVSRSTFQARVARVNNVHEVAAVLAHVLEDGRVASATHPAIRAYRIEDSSSHTVIADNDDDGETAAGGRLATLLEMMRASNVLVIVTRWFGGTLLGPQRFKIISNVAREAIEAQPWYEGRKR